MLDLSSMNLSQLQTALSTVKTQISLYSGYIGKASKMYGNIMTKINSVKSSYSDSKQTLENAKHNIKNKKVESPIPDDLMVTEDTNSDVAVNNIELACMQITKEESTEKINKYMDLKSKLEEWKEKLEKQIQILSKKLAENEVISAAKKYTTSEQSTLNNANSEAKTLITKTVDAKDNTTTTISKIA